MRDFFEHRGTGADSSAGVVMEYVMELVDPCSVVDVGCGTGEWLAAAQLLGVDEVLGMDGPHVPSELLRISPESFVPIDLAQPLQMDRTFDLAISLEVAEHLPEDRSRAFVADLTRLAPVVLFSAAIPQQGGTGHLNEQWPEYWVALFAGHGFVPIDCLRPRIWDDPRVAWWYRQNLMILANDEAIATRPGLTAEAERWGRGVRAQVHPELFLSRVKRPDPSVRMAVRETIAAVRRGIARRFTAPRRDA